MCFNWSTDYYASIFNFFKFFRDNILNLLLSFIFFLKIAFNLNKLLFIIDLK